MAIKNHTTDDELIKRLLEISEPGQDKCDGCPWEEDYPDCTGCISKTTRKAAEIIEELSKARPTATAALVAYHFGIKVMECSACHKRSLGRNDYCPCCGAKYVPVEDPS